MANLYSPPSTPRELELQRVNTFVVAENDQLRARIKELEAENFKLAAGQCIVKNGLLGNEGGNQYCRLEAEKAQAVEAVWAEIERVVATRAYAFVNNEQEFLLREIRARSKP